MDHVTLSLGLQQDFPQDSMTREQPRQSVYFGSGSRNIQAVHLVLTEIMIIQHQVYTFPLHEVYTYNSLAIVFASTQYQSIPNNTNNMTSVLNAETKVQSSENIKKFIFVMEHSPDQCTSQYTELIAQSLDIHTRRVYMDADIYIETKVTKDQVKSLMNYKPKLIQTMIRPSLSPDFKWLRLNHFLSKTRKPEFVLIEDERQLRVFRNEKQVIDTTRPLEQQLKSPEIYEKTDGDKFELEMEGNKWIKI